MANSDFASFLNMDLDPQLSKTMQSFEMNTEGLQINEQFNDEDFDDELRELGFQSDEETATITEPSRTQFTEIQELALQVEKLKSMAVQAHKEDKQKGEASNESPFYD